MFGRGWVGIIAYLESLFDGSPLATILVLLGALVVVRVLLMLLQGHGLAPAHAGLPRRPARDPLGPV